MTDEELKHLRDLCDAAAPGPWTYDDERSCTELICASITAIPKLIDELERLKAQLKIATDTFKKDWRDT